MGVVRGRWVVGLLTLLFLSLAANVVLFRLLRERYARQLEQQVWPAGPAETPRVSGSLRPDAPTVLLIGDSRIAQWPSISAPSPERWVNAGVNGLAAAQIRLRLPALLQEFQPKLVVVQAGINDLKLLGLRPDLAASLVPQTAGHLEAIADLARARQARVLLLEVWPAREPDLLRRAVWSPVIAEGVEGVNQRLRRLSSPSRGIRVVDLFRAAQTPVTPALFRDTLHLTSESYERLTPALQKEVAQILDE